MLEWLKTVLGDSYTEDIDKKISQEIGKNFVARADYNTLNETKKTLETSIAERDTQIEELKKVDASALQAKISELSEANKTAKTEYEENLKKITLNSKIETALMGAKARDAKLTMAALDMSKISLDGENVIGLSDQLESLQKDKAFLFDDAPNSNPKPPYGGEPGITPQLETTDMSAYIEARKKL